MAKYGSFLVNSFTYFTLNEVANAGLMVIGKATKTMQMPHGRSSKMASFCRYYKYYTIGKPTIADYHPSSQT
jgi:hypothetical protein